MDIIVHTILIDFNHIIKNKRHTLSMRTNDRSYCQASAKRVENTLVLLDTCLRGRFPAINANYYCRLSLQFFALSGKADKQHVVNLARKKSSIRENGSLLEMSGGGGATG